MPSDISPAERLLGRLSVFGGMTAGGGIMWRPNGLNRAVELFELAADAIAEVRRLQAERAASRSAELSAQQQAQRLIVQTDRRARTEATQAEQLRQSGLVNYLIGALKVIEAKGRAGESAAVLAQIASDALVARPQ
jgi:hypothetical protein